MSGRDPIEALGAFYQAHQAAAYEPRATPPPDGFWKRWFARSWATPAVLLVVLLGMLMLPATRWLPRAVWEGVLPGIRLGSFYQDSTPSPFVGYTLDSLAADEDGRSVPLKTLSSVDLGASSYNAPADSAADIWQRLSAILAVTQHDLSQQRTPSDLLVEMRDLHSLAKRYPNDPSLAAHWVRFHGLVSWGLGPAPGLSQEEQAERAEAFRAVAKSLLEAAQLGIERDPQNAYFRLAAATALRKLGRGNEADSALLAASNSRFYRDYATEEFQLWRKAFRKVWGEHPQVLFSESYNAILLPHYAMLRTGFPEPLNGPEMHRAVATVGLMMIRDAKSGFDLNYGAGNFRLALRGDRKGDQITDEALAKDLDQADRTGGFYSNGLRSTSNWRTGLALVDANSMERQFVAARLVSVLFDPLILPCYVLAGGPLILIMAGIVRRRAKRRQYRDVTSRARSHGFQAGYAIGGLVLCGYLTTVFRDAWQMPPLSDTLQVGSWLLLIVTLLALHFVTPSLIRVRDMAWAYLTCWLGAGIVGVAMIGGLEVTTPRTLDRQLSLVEEARREASQLPGGSEVGSLIQK